MSLTFIPPSLFFFFNQTTSVVTNWTENSFLLFYLNYPSFITNNIFYLLTVLFIIYCLISCQSYQCFFLHLVVCFSYFIFFLFTWFLLRQVFPFKCCLIYLFYSNVLIFFLLYFQKWNRNKVWLIICKNQILSIDESKLQRNGLTNEIRSCFFFTNVDVAVRR